MEDPANETSSATTLGSAPRSDRTHASPVGSSAGGAPNIGRRSVPPQRAGLKRGRKRSGVNGIGHPEPASRVLLTIVIRPRKDASRARELAGAKARFGESFGGHQSSNSLPERSQLIA